MSRHQTTGQSQFLKAANKSFENVANLKYLETTVKNQNCIFENIKGRLNSGNACYHTVQNILSFLLLSKNVWMKNIQNYNFTCSFLWL
jgi:hypothetical protein